jgi:hypothetical protein
MVAGDAAHNFPPFGGQGIERVPGFPCLGVAIRTHYDMSWH